MAVFIRNFGCSSNTSDGEVMAGCLAKAGYPIADIEAEADVLIFNTCAVKGPTENRIINAIKQAPKNKKIVITGCLPKISFERLMQEARFDAVVGPAVGKQIVDVVARVLAGEKVVDISAVQQLPSLHLPHKPSSPVVSIVPINFGCLGSCSYCCVVHARGHLRSYGVSEVSCRVQEDLALGAKEFWVTSQDTACYGRDIKTNLAQLLTRLTALPGFFQIRVGMMTPNMVVDMQGQLIEAFGSSKVFKFLHLPVQSGDDGVLRGMRRFYTAGEFLQIAGAFRAAYKDLTLATDVIVGFPGETEEAFENTLELMRQVKPDVTNVSKFFARPKTPAWDMREGLVGKEETKRRSGVAADLARQLSAERNLRWVGWRGEVLIDERGKVEGTWVGRNFAYKPVAVESGEDLLGKTVRVEVLEACGTYLRGKIEK